MDASKIRKSLEYLDEFISAEERRAGAGQRTIVSDARKGYDYIYYFLNDLSDEDIRPGDYGKYETIIVPLGEPKSLTI